MLSRMLSNILLNSGIGSGILKKAHAGRFILSIYFHDPSRKEFEGCVGWLKAHGFHFLTLSELLSIHKNEQPFPAGAVVLTVDDGWKSNQANIVQVAEKLKVPVAIFISTEPVEKGWYWWSYIEQAVKTNLTSISVAQLKKVPNENRLRVIGDLKERISLSRNALTVQQIQEIAKSPHITMGSHTHTHPILTNCSVHQVCAEVEISKEKIESWTGKEVSTFAYPNGSYSARERDILEAHKFQLAFTTQAQYLTREALDHPLDLPRFEVRSNVPFEENICRMLGIWEILFQRLKRNFSFARV